MTAEYAEAFECCRGRYLDDPPKAVDGPAGCIGTDSHVLCFRRILCLVAAADFPLLPALLRVDCMLVAPSLDTLKLVFLLLSSPNRILSVMGLRATEPLGLVVVMKTVLGSLGLSLFPRAPPSSPPEADMIEFLEMGRSR